MNTILSHPTGNEFVRAAVSFLNKSNVLLEFDTTLAVDTSASFIKFLPNKIKQEFLRRSFPLPSEKIYTHRSLELARLLLSKIGLQYFVRHEKGWASVDSIYESFDKAVAKRLLAISNKFKLNTVYAYEDCALNTFTISKQLGINCTYDLPIAYWEFGRQLMQEEAERLPVWAGTLAGGILDSPLKLERKVTELQLADTVVVPSQFVLDSLPSWSKEKKIIVAPFGTPAGFQNATFTKKNIQSANKPLRVLFAGSMGQRKGLGDLFTAIKILNRSDIELVVMGSLIQPLDFYTKQLKSFTYELGRPHHEVLKLMRTCDIFCLPSIVEGRALVMQEAMSQGLPLIITANTGGTDLIKEGQTGFLVPIRSPEIIAEKLEWFLDNRSKIPEMSSKSQEHAALYTWEKYGEKILESVTNPQASGLKI